MASKQDILEALESLGVPAEANDDVVPSGERNCPICQNVMRVEKHAGVAIDVCRAHGVWLDNGELMELLARREGPLTMTPSALAKARREGKIAGIALGAWSLLLD